MKVIIVKAVLGWDPNYTPSMTLEKLTAALHAVDVDILITDDCEMDTPALSVHNAIVDEIDMSARQDLPTRDDLPVAPVAKESK